jgi:hypothetical protein
MLLQFRTYRGKAILKMVENLVKEGNVIRSPEYGNVVDGIYGGSPEGIKIDPPANIRGIGMDRLAGSCGHKISFTKKQQEKVVLIHLGTKYYELYSTEKELNKASFPSDVCEFIAVDN